MRKAFARSHVGRSGLGRVVAVLLAASLIAGCLGRNAAKPAAVLDFGPALAQDAAPALALRALDVAAPSWLDTPTLQYRLAYLDPARRFAYAESRWAAAPGELLERGLRRALLGNAAGAAGCRLRIELDEFIHTFDSATASHAEMALRATLLSAQAERMLARKAFRLSEPAASADPRGGAEALGRSAAAAATALQSWLSTQPAEIGKLCSSV
ncbi:MAG: membrane integrity-associated transporter subunit PqiC [Rhodocyclaceae bacterium]|nr:membrane integrity-associated transporter subunit PqiC [Rhodocyclaceae bacterium]MBX3670578.1 membrane integrity-associated transporter subunit PqiC [Rhodocyclaceae bacterium]